MNAGNDAKVVHIARGQPDDDEVAAVIAALLTRLAADSPAVRGHQGNGGRKRNRRRPISRVTFLPAHSWQAAPHSDGEPRVTVQAG